uniref:CSON011690 protein n=1 Tax=Culicoides sonorensis TaxID=179676 RepID=A0A336LQ50_CULSO
MLLKYTNGPLAGKGSGKGKGKFIRVNGGLRVNNSLSSINNRIYRRHYYRLPGKRPNQGKLFPRISPPHPCDNSNDSGLGVEGVNNNNNSYFTERNQEQQQQQQQTQQINLFQNNIISSAALASTTLQPETTKFFFFNHHKDSSNSFKLTESHANKDECRRPKRARVASISLESEDACSIESFMATQRDVQDVIGQQPINYSITTNQKRTTDSSSSKYSSMTKRISHAGAASCSNSHVPPEGSVSKNGQVKLEIISQPEQQHRARYQTEGSRGAVKDRRGSGFPIVKLSGYNKPAKLQIYIGTDVGRAVPHMFYQACKVSSKNSTPCSETKIDGTVVIEVDVKPETDMMVTCDCIGILKERNVDVELRFPDQLTPKNKKKSTKCRMIFKTEITNDDGTTESLFICSQPIVCTQPPGVPEICRKSITESSCLGGQDLFIIGKNFAKDTRVVFKAVKKGRIWEESVVPEQEFLQQTHLICTVPPYFDTDIVYPVNVHLFIVSNGKKSESHSFLYMPQSTTANTMAQLTLNAITSGTKTIQQAHGNPSQRTDVPIFVSSAEFTENMSQNTDNNANETKINMMAPPPALPPSTVSVISIDLQQEPRDLQAFAAVKAELLEETSQSSLIGCSSRTESNLGDFNPKLDENQKMDIAQNSVEMMVTQPSLNLMPTNMLELQIKQEIVRRGSLTQQDEINLMTSENLNLTSNINPTTTMYPQTVPIQSETNKSQMMVDQYHVNLVAATTAQLSLHTPNSVSQDVIMQDTCNMRSPENIMNVNIAPTMMVPTVHGDLESVNPMLSSNTLLPPTQSIVSNLSPTPSSSSSSSSSSTAVPMDQTQINITERTSPVAVKNMILDAAAEILSSPQQPSAETQSTINALIAMNTELNETKNPTTTQQQQQLSITAVSPSTENHSQTQLMDKEIRSEMTLNSCSTSPSNALLHVMSKSQSLSLPHQSTITSESQLQNNHQQQQLQQQQQQQQLHLHHQQQAQQSTSATVQTSIPQEIATMSESDLISFINPNAFDQGMYKSYYFRPIGRNARNNN